METLPKDKENNEIRGLAYKGSTVDETGWVVTNWSKRTMRPQKELASFESILKGLSPGQRWVDPDIPLGQDDEPIIWKWPEEVWNSSCVTPALFMDKATESDVKQGACASCWFLADLCVVAMHPRLMKDIIVAQDDKHGVYCFRFFTNSGHARLVCVDSRIPVLTASPYFEPAYAASREPGELWPTLLEKAMAKACGGSYESICRGYMARGLSALLGRVARSYDRNMQKGDKRFADPDQLWGLMHDRLWLGGCLMDAAFLGNPEVDATFAGGEGVGFAGLVEGHSYGVMGLYTTKAGTRLVKFRNPWGIGHEWKGPWSDGSVEWDSVNQRVRNSVGYVEAADGTFFMAIEDVSRYLENLGAARVFSGRAEVSVKRATKRSIAVEGKRRRKVV